MCVCVCVCARMHVQAHVHVYMWGEFIIEGADEHIVPLEVND